MHAPLVVIISPHPDDECIVGGLALRLALEHGWRVVNVAVTHGSRLDRRRARAEELANACAYLGFETIALDATQNYGFEGIQLNARSNDTRRWTTVVQVLVETLQRLQPQLIIAPHAGDAQITHVGTHWLLHDALHRVPQIKARVALCEYWSTLEHPNLMVELSAAHVGTLIGALSQHKGEIERNPYHVSLPLHLHDNVRRGSERVGAPGAEVMPFQFASLYQLGRFVEGTWHASTSPGRFARLGTEFEHIFLENTE